MFTPRDDKYRQKILRFITKHLEKQAQKGLPFNEIAYFEVNELRKELKMSDEKFDRVTNILLSNADIAYKRGDDGSIYILPGKNMAKSYYSGKYIREGQDRQIARIKDFLSITVQAIAIATAIGGILTAVTKQSSNKEQIIQLRKELDTVKSQLTPLIHK